MIELANYNKVVAQRNKLLKEISFSGRMADTLEIWDEQMVRYGTSIISERKKFISRLNDILSEIHQNLTGGKEQILITYEPNVSEEAFSEELKAGRERDLRFGQSYTCLLYTSCVAVKPLKVLSEKVPADFKLM